MAKSANSSLSHDGTLERMADVGVAVPALDTLREAMRDSEQETGREADADEREADLDPDHGRDMSRRRVMDVSLSLFLAFSLETSRNAANKVGERTCDRVAGCPAEADFL